MKKLKIFWNRSDSRLTDNPALYYALQAAREEGCELLSLFILDPHFVANPVYSRRLRYMVGVLESYGKVIDQNVTINSPSFVFKELAKIYEIEIFANADLEPYGRKRDLEILELCKDLGAKFNLLNDKTTVDLAHRSKTGTIYGIFSPFKRSVMESFLNAKTLPKVELEGIKQLNHFDKFDFAKFEAQILPLSINVNGESIDLSILDKHLDFDWYNNEIDCLKHFKSYLKNDYNNYDKSRDDLASTNSLMSVALKWGLVSARILKDMIIEVDTNPQESTYISELIWREFYKYILYHYPLTLDHEYQSKFRDNQSLWVPKNEQIKRLKIWINSQTGYPIVDAAMKQIIKEGYMHNRARMVVASILTKNLGVDWRLGQEYFRAMLLDLDEASNNGGWQWSASVGADPKPIRIFNPYTQDEKFDISNGYKSKFNPQPATSVPFVEHPIAREQTLLRFEEAKKNHSQN
jgi:deoxyribodipyrimidine photo-lyase